MTDSATNINKQSTEQVRPKLSYSLEELLAVSDFTKPETPEEREWVDAQAVGGEMI
jgi:antitoxin ChpS